MFPIVKVAESGQHNRSFALVGKALHGEICGTDDTSNVGYGSLADLLTNITPTAASGAKPAVREADFQNSILIDCFTQKRSFSSDEVCLNGRDVTHQGQGWPMTL